MVKPQQEEETILEELHLDTEVQDISKNIDKSIFIGEKMILGKGYRPAKRSGRSAIT